MHYTFRRVSHREREGQRNLHSNDAELKGLYCRCGGTGGGWRDGYPVKLSQANTESVGSVQRQFMKGIQAVMLQLL